MSKKKEPEVKAPKAAKSEDTIESLRARVAELEAAIAEVSAAHARQLNFAARQKR